MLPRNSYGYATFILMRAGAPGLKITREKWELKPPEIHHSIVYYPWCHLQPGIGISARIIGEALPFRILQSIGFG
jgi:hypothetical protein